EDVMEAEEAVDRMHETSFRQSLEMAHRILVRREVVELRAGETPTDHGGAAQYAELARIEAVEPAREQRRHCRGRLLEREVRGFSREREPLFGKERIAAGLLDDAPFQFRIHRLG